MVFPQNVITKYSYEKRREPRRTNVLSSSSNLYSNINISLMNYLIKKYQDTLQNKIYLFVFSPYSFCLRNNLFVNDLEIKQLSSFAQISASQYKFKTNKTLYLRHNHQTFKVLIQSLGFQDAGELIFNTIQNIGCFHLQAFPKVILHHFIFLLFYI